MTRLIAIVIATVAAAASVLAQAPATRQGAAPAPTARAQAPRDITGYWVSIVTEDWIQRMGPPRKGDYTSLPLNEEGRRAAERWDPAADVKGGNSCRPFGAAGVMRIPGRLHITWESDSTLKIETDAGTQTRRFTFGEARARGWRTNPRGEAEWVEAPSPRPAPAPASWQGTSVARWDLASDPNAVRAVAFFPGGLGTGPNGAGMVAPGRFGSLHVVTANLKTGYLRRNGVPYSAEAVLTEDYDFRTEDDGTEWFTVTTVVDDPKYLSAPFITSTDFRKEPDGSKWSPTTCAAY